MEDPIPYFEDHSVDEIYSEIQTVYKSDSRPWIIGYSGGKDSTTALQLIWYAIEDLPPSERTKQIYVISSDTLVETPVIVDYIDNSLNSINKIAQEKSLPFQAHKVQPITKETFWVNLIGKGYPAPSNQFRWCTERMKIKPADRFIIDRVSQHGEVVIILGVREAESMTRAQVMSLHRIKNSVLSRHSRFSGAFVYTPIRLFTLDDVWGYLSDTPNPWGLNNQDLVSLYRNANSGECPLVIDKTTPSCGNSRFGCWTCTVVGQDKSMESLIENGFEWMSPLLEIRNFLSSTQDPALKDEIRDYRGGRGNIRFNRDGSGKIVPGPYKLNFCFELLEKLLKAEKQIQKEGPDKNLELIGREELHEIRRIWRTERGDWDDTLPKIYQQVLKEDLSWVEDDIGIFGAEENKLLQELCEKEDIPSTLIKKLISTELESQGMKRKAKVYGKIDSVLTEEWRTKNEVLEEYQRLKKESILNDY